MSANQINYDDVKNYVIGALNRTDPRVDTNINTFIMLGQRTICRELNIVGFQKFMDGFFIPGQQFIEKPFDWLVTFSFGTYFNNPYQTEFNNYQRLKKRIWTYCSQFDQDNTSEGVPQQYSDMEYSQWRFVPTPDQAYPYTIGYYQIPDLLSDSNQQNFLTRYNPDAVMNAAVMEANFFLQNYNEADIWKKRFNESMDSMKRQDNRLVGDIGDYFLIRNEVEK